MGRGIFGIDFGSVAFAIKKTKSEDAIGSYFRLHERNFQHILYKDIEKLFLYSNCKVDYKYDFNQYRGEEGITEIPKNGNLEGNKLFYPNIPQTNFTKIPGNPIAYWVSERIIKLYKNERQLIDITTPRQGLITGDNSKFVRSWSEINFNKIQNKWFKFNKGGAYRKWFGNHDEVVNWQNNGFDLKNFTDNKGKVRSTNSKYRLLF